MHCNLIGVSLYFASSFESLSMRCRYDLMHDDFTAVSLSHASAIAIAQCCVVYETGVHYRQVLFALAFIVLLTFF